MSCPSGGVRGRPGGEVIGAVTGEHLPLLECHEGPLTFPTCTEHCTYFGGRPAIDRVRPRIGDGLPIVWRSPVLAAMQGSGSGVAMKLLMSISFFLALLATYPARAA